MNSAVVARGGRVYVSYGTRMHVGDHGGVVRQQLSTSTDHGQHFGPPISIGPLSVLRYAIRTEIRLITSELATDLARFPGLNKWTTEDLNVLATLFVNAMIVIAEAIEDSQSIEATEDIRRLAVKQLRMIATGIAGWQSTP